MPKKPDSPSYSEQWEKNWSFMVPSYLSTFIIVQFRALVRWHKGQEEPVCFNASSCKQTHHFQLQFLNGIETVEIISHQSNQSTDYLVYCCGIEENALSFDASMLRASQNAIVWNYPGKGRSQGYTQSLKDLVMPAMQQVLRLLDKGVPAKNITLYGYSLGGGVAAQAARRLHEKGHFIHLEIDRSFSHFSSVIPALVYQATPSKAPFISAILALTIYALTLGVAFTGLVNALGHLLFNRLPRGEDLCAFEKIGNIIQVALNGIASVIGGIFVICGMICGVILGTLLGALLSVQHIWTEKPFLISTHSAFKSVLRAFQFEMDTVHELQQLIKARHRFAKNTDEKPRVLIKNTINDEVIPVTAALNTGLGYQSIPSPSSSPYKNHLSFFWYSKGGHQGALSEPLHSMVCA